LQIHESAVQIGKAAVQRIVGARNKTRLIGTKEEC
jgi:hypothetical protein